MAIKNYTAGEKKPRCRHCVHGTDADVNSIGEQIIYCELTAEWMNVTLGDCFGNCESEEVE